jgi:hypothetical protein
MLEWLTVMPGPALGQVREFGASAAAAGQDPSGAFRRIHKGLAGKRPLGETMSKKPKCQAIPFIE